MGNIKESPSGKEQVVWNISWLITEVNNGRFHQFFFNGSGANAIQAVRDLRAIGASKTASIVEAACNVFPRGRPAEHNDRRISQLDRFSEEQLQAFCDLDEEFYGRDEDLCLMLRQFWERPQ